jgi:hypothetical protein
MGKRRERDEEESHRTYFKFIYFGSQQKELPS